jgi:hypothetical protein
LACLDMYISCVMLLGTIRSMIIFFYVSLVFVMVQLLKSVSCDFPLHVIGESCLVTPSVLRLVSHAHFSSWCKSNLIAMLLSWLERNYSWRMTKAWTSLLAQLCLIQTMSLGAAGSIRSLNNHMCQTVSEIVTCAG